MKDNRYPHNWKAISEERKRAANWICQDCGLDCCPSWFGKLLGYSRSDRKRLEMSVHHSDYVPENNSLSNLIPLCSACHLKRHIRGKGNEVPGQLKLNL